MRAKQQHCLACQAFDWHQPIFVVKLDAKDSGAVRLAAERLARGDVLAFPTETVYGLGARADDDLAVAKIYALKGRPSEHPLIVHVVNAQAALAFVEQIPAVAQRLIDAHWPGPLTLVFQRRQGVAGAAAGGHPTIAVRCPAHPVAQALLAQGLALGVPGVAAPSANRFGRVSPTTADHVLQEFGDALPVLDAGPCELGIESAIVDVSRGSPVLLRPGVLTTTVLGQSAGEAVTSAQDDETAPRASGTLAAHYAPNAKVRLMPAKLLRDALLVLGDEGLPKLAVYARTVQTTAKGVMRRRMPDGARAAAHELFAVLRELDAAGATLIWVEEPPADPAWDGVRDRLQRAAATA